MRPPAALVVARCRPPYGGCSTTGPRRRRWRGRRSTRGAADGGGVGGADKVGHGRNGGAGTGTVGPPVSAGVSPRRGAPGRDARRGVRVAAAKGRGKRQPTGRHAAVAARCARNGHSPSSVMIASGTLYAWRELSALVGDCPGQFPIGGSGPGDGFRPFWTKADDGGRHRRRRQVNSVFMSWRFDRPDFLDLESHSGCRASLLDGRYFPPPEVTPLIVVLQGWAPSF